MTEPPVTSLAPDPTAMEWLRFGPFLFDPATGELTRQGRRIALQPQPARALHYLAEHSGEVVTRGALQQWLWGGERTVDSEHGLNYCILQVRRALADDADRPTFVETIPRRGYRFLVPATREPRRPAHRSFPAWRRLLGAVARALGLPRSRARSDRSPPGR